MKIERIDIGKEIKSEVCRQNITFAAFAKSIGVLRQNIESKVFSKKSIDTELLRLISETLGVNFFECYLSDKQKKLQCNHSGLRLYENSIKEVKAILTLEVQGEVERKEEVFVFLFGKQE